jgi:hypothetical protein
VDRSWVSSAACLTSPLDFVPRQANGQDIARLCAVCRRCDVRLSCLAYALDVEAVGCWGGRYLPQPGRRRRDAVRAARRELRAAAAFRDLRAATA